MVNRTNAAAPYHGSKYPPASDCSSGTGLSRHRGGWLPALETGCYGAPECRSRSDPSAASEDQPWLAPGSPGKYSCLDRCAEIMFPAPERSGSGNGTRQPCRRVSNTVGLGVYRSRPALGKSAPLRARGTTRSVPIRSHVHPSQWLRLSIWRASSWATAAPAVARWSESRARGWKACRVGAFPSRRSRSSAQ